MYSGLSDFIKAIRHPSGWDTFPPERSDEVWEEMPPPLGMFLCMCSPVNICVHYKKESSTSVELALYSSVG